jgi:CRP-like cAMP-binding protein
MSNKFFSLLSEEEKDVFLASCEKVVVMKDEMIIHKDEQSRDFYVIKDGAAMAIDEWDEDTVPLAIFAEGDVFGEMSFLLEGPRSATVLANEDCVLYRMNAAKFEDFMKENADIASRFLLGLSRILVQRLQYIDDAFTTIAVMNKELKKNTEAMKQALLGIKPEDE